MSALNHKPQRRKLVRRKLFNSNVVMVEILKAKGVSEKKKEANIHILISGKMQRNIIRLVIVRS